MKKYIVKERFQDAAKYVAKDKEPRIYEAGEDVSKFDKERLDNLVSEGLVEVSEVKESAK